MSSLPIPCPSDQPDPGRPRECQTVRDVIDAYFQLGLDEVCERVRGSRRYQLELFLQAYGDRQLSDCRPVDLLAWIKAHAEWASEWTRRNVIAGVKRAFNFCLDMELIQRNPFGRFRSRGMLPNRRQPMADEHYQALMRFSPPFWRRFAVFVKFSGCRPGEAAAMRWSDVRFEESCVILQRHKTTRKTNKPRIIPLVPTTVKLLLWMRVRRQATVVGLLARLLRQGAMKGVQVARFMSHYGVSDRAVARARAALGVIKERTGGTGPKGYYTYRLPHGHVPPPDPSDSDFVFVTCLGHQLTRSNIALWAGRTRRRARLPEGVSLYGLRHRYGLMGVKNGVNLKLLSLAMGHESTIMTEHYIYDAGLTDNVKEAALQIVYGPGAVGIPTAPPPKPVATICSPAIESIPAATEQLPSRYGLERARPQVPAGLADVPLPAPGSEPGEQSLEQMMRQLMTRLCAQRKRVLRQPTSSRQELSPTHAQAYQAVAWAVERQPELLKAKDRAIFEWLKLQPDCPFKLPPTFATFARYLSAARLYYDTRKRILNHRAPPAERGGVA